MISVDEIQAHLRARTLPGLDGLLPDGEFVMPHYEGLGLANLPATIAALLGVELEGGCPPLWPQLWSDWADGLKRVVLVVIDALGYLQLRAAQAKWDDLVFGRLAEAGRMVPLTSTFPSTTNTVLTTLWTGYGPGAHGLLAYELFLRELGVAASTLFFWPIFHRQRDALREWGLETASFVPVPSLAEQLAERGVTTRAYVSKAYADSALSQIHRRGAREITGFVGGSDMWMGLQSTIERRAGERLLLTAYWDTIDGITHQYGPDHDAWDVELRGISWMIEHAFASRLTKSQRDGTLLLLTADHGGVTTPPRAAVRLDKHAGLRDALSMPPVGESRVPFLYTRGDTFQRVERYLRERLSDAFVTLTRQQVLESGLLGPPPYDDETPHRLGDLVCLARGNRYLARDWRQTRMLGRHGGLSAREMLVPLIGVRLDAL